MADNRPWGINSIGSMIGPLGCVSASGGQFYEFVRAVPEPYHTFGLERLRAAWWVLTGRAHAVVWPKAGDLERAVGGPLP